MGCLELIKNLKPSHRKGFKNGAGYGSLLELFNKTLRPTLNTSNALILFNDIKNYLESAA